MQWKFTVSAIILLCTSGLSIVVAALLFHRRRTRGISTLALVMTAVGYWCLVAGLESAAFPLWVKVVFSKLEYVGMQSVAVLFLVFAFRHSGRTAWMSWRSITALCFLPLVAVLLAATNEYHRLVWSAFSPGPEGSNAIIYHHGIGFFFVIAVTYLYLVVASAVLIDSAIRSPTIQRRQSVACLIAMAVPWASGILYALNINLIPGLNLPPLSFSVAGIILAVGVVPLGLFDLVPVARELLIKSMSDGIIVVDDQHRIVEVNPAAKNLLKLPLGTIGGEAESMLNGLPQVAESFNLNREVHFDVTISQDPLLHLDIRVAPLQRNSRAAGFLIVIRDISKRYRAEISLQKANQRLRTQVSQIQHLQDELRDQAIRDPLTGLFNRRHLDDMVPRLIERASRSSKPISVILLDLDHFKEVNDTYGHRAGDAVLETLGNLLLENTRAGDIPCRYGGEEFVLVLPESPLNAAVERTEQLRQAFRNAIIPGLGSNKPPTISAGIAVFPTHGMTQDELFHAADVALYKAKKAGRDCVQTPN
jgi:diguanylate cyclase (GGDEF)-like protein